jgi:hypothetical protein
MGGILSGVTRASSILATDETIPPRLPPGQIIHPPEYFRAHFERDLEGALRDVAGSPRTPMPRSSATRV